MDERPKILVVSPYRTEYGPRRVLHHVAEALDRAGYSPICVLPPDATIDDSLRELVGGLHFVEGLATFPRTLNPGRLASFFAEHVAAADKIARIARAHDARAVYSASEAIFCGGLAARRAAILSVTHVIGMSIQSPAWSAHVYIRSLARLTDAFVACSSAVAEMLAAYGVGDEKIIVAHNAISMREIDTAADWPDPTSYEGRKIGMVAAFDPRKGHELFVESARRVARRRPDARFYIIGGALKGQEESLAFERRIRNLVVQSGLDASFVTTGYVPVPDIYPWIRAMDVVVVPSKTEAFAHALLEAMALAKPVIATAIEGNLDAFVDGHSGIYVDQSPAQLADAVLAVLDDPALAARMGCEARERVALCFDVTVLHEVVAHIVHELLAQSPRPAPAASAARATRITTGDG